MSTPPTDSTLDGRHIAAANRITELKTENEQLREALRDCREMADELQGGTYDVSPTDIHRRAEEALSSTTVKGVGSTNKFRVWEEGEYTDLAEYDAFDYRIRPDGTVSILVYTKEGRKVEDGICRTIAEEIMVSEVQVEWFTGREDAEHQPIYQGDLLRVPSAAVEDGPHPVKWSTRHASWVVGPEWFLGTLLERQGLRVVGNVHEGVTTE